MKKLAALLVLSTGLTAPLVHGQPPGNAAGALDAAKQWLAAADANDGAATWDQAAPAFQAAISRQAWSDALKQARQPFGKVEARTLVSSERKHALPGAPDGDYVVLMYDTRFAHKAHAVETVVPVRDQDGRWKVSGYFVK